MPPAKYILVANTDDKDEVAKAKKAMDDKEKELQDANTKIAKLEAQVPDPHAPEVRNLKSTLEATLKAMDDEEHENMKGMDEEHKEAMKKAVKTAMEVFDEGNGEQVNNKTQVGETQKEPATKVIEAAVAKALAPVERKLKIPIINKILKAKTLQGATEDDMKKESERLGKMSLKGIEEEFSNNKIFIEGTLKANVDENDINALTAKEESNFDFNGIQSNALTGNSVSIDDALEKIAL